MHRRSIARCHRASILLSDRSIRFIVWHAERCKSTIRAMLHTKLVALNSQSVTACKWTNSFQLTNINIRSIWIKWDAKNIKYDTITRWDEQCDVDQTGDCSTNRNRMIERYVCNFKARGERRATEGDKRRKPSTTMWRERKKKAEVRRLNRFGRFICEKENLVFDSLIYLKPVESFTIGVMWWNVNVLVTHWRHIHTHNTTTSSSSSSKFEADVSCYNAANSRGLWISCHRRFGDADIFVTYIMKSAL